VSFVRPLLVAVVLGALLSACNPSVSPPAYQGVQDPSLVTAAALEPCPVSGAPIANGLPKITLHCLDGKGTVDLAGLRGPALINFWYSTCPDCRTEAPLLEAFRRAAKGSVAVLGIDTDLHPDDGLKFAISAPVHYASVVDEHSDVPPKLAVIGYPSTYFLDAAGHLVGPPHPGLFKSAAELRAAVKARLGITVP
jgi:thiol-disulfide isomerase/thioredoxin